LLSQATDKGNAHWTYKNAPSFRGPKPLHATNRAAAMDWVIALGAKEQIEENEGNYIDLDRHDMELIKAGLPIWPRPRLPKAYTTYR
jgi:hypothetical protein